MSISILSLHLLNINLFKNANIFQSCCKSEASKVLFRVLKSFFLQKTYSKTYRKTIYRLTKKKKKKTEPKIQVLSNLINIDKTLRNWST